MSGINRLIKAELATSGKPTQSKVRSAFTASNIRSEKGNRVDKKEYSKK